MVDTPATPVAVASATPKKSPKAKKEKKTTGKPKVAKKASHPSTVTMVNNAVAELKERKGSSLPAIKKYIASTYKVDVVKSAQYIRRAIQASIASGTLVQVQGTGANGRFKIPVAEKVKKPAAAAKSAKPKVAKPAAAASKKAAVSKKVAKPKKSPVKKSPVKPKSPAKAKKSPKPSSPKKPKSPKVKAAKSPKAKASKKAVKSPKKK